MFVSARRHASAWTRLASLLTSLALITALGVTANAATASKPYTATWLSSGVPMGNPPNRLALSSGATTAVLRITNGSSPQSLGAANITLPPRYTLIGGALSTGPGSATPSGNTLLLRDLGLAPSSSVDVTISLRTPCTSSGPDTWTLVVKQANSFSGPPGNDFSMATGTVAPSTSVSGSTCLLRFANQPDTTRTGALITDGYNGTGNGLRVEIYDPGTGLRVNSSAEVTLTLGFDPAGGLLSGGGATAAVGGVATFAALSIDKAGPYKLLATSPAASAAQLSDQFLVSDTVTECSGTGCSFREQFEETTLTVTPKKGSQGADFVASLNLSGVRISCDFDPFNYPDSRQPNTVFYTYDDGTNASTKTNVIIIDKAWVQLTPENGASKYRICYSSPVPFKDRTGGWAQPDPWPDGPTAYFGVTWYTGLLPDCVGSKPTQLPCSLGFTGSGSGDRMGTFLTPAGDPFIR